MKGKKNIVRLFANENFYGCSSKVHAVIKKNNQKASLYPNFNPVLLETKIAEKFGVKPSNIAVGAGSVRVLDGVIQAFVNTDEEILIFENSFSAYSQLAEIHKRKYFFAKQTDFRCDVNNLFPYISDKTRVIFIANPNNPTGTIITHNELKNLLKKISPDTFIVIDEAYLEYVNDKNFPDSILLLKEFPNLIIVRTFSKVYGLAGLRIGYAIANEKNINQLKQCRIPFSINYLAEDAAIAALEDEKFIKQSTAANAGQRQYLFTELKKIGLNTIPTQANFIYLWFENDVEKKKIYDKLFAIGIIICDMKVFGNDKSLRVSIGDREVCKRIIKCLS